MAMNNTSYNLRQQLNFFLHTKRYLDSLLLWIGSLGVYLWTLMPGVGGFGDTGIFQFVGKVLGVPHTPGYPNYTLFTHIFSYFPFGTYAFKANLFSALCAASGIAILHRVLLRFSKRPLFAIASAGTVAFTYTLWSQAVIAEVYALNILFYTATLYFFIRWYFEDKITLFLLGCYTYALSFGNHLTMITLFPALLYLVWVRHRDYYFSPHIVFTVLFFILLGVSQYFYLFARTYNLTTPYVEIAVPNFRELFYQLTGGPFRSLYSSTSLQWMIFIQLPILLRFIWKEYSVLLFIIAFGFVTFKDFHLALFLLLAGGAVFGFALSYQIIDIYIYLLPLYVILAFFLENGLESIFDAFISQRYRQLQYAVLVLPFIFLFANYEKANENDDVSDAEFVHSVVERIPPRSIILCPDFTYATYMWYYLYTERPAADSVYLFFPFSEFPVYHLKQYAQGKEYLYLPVQRKFIPTGFQIYLFRGYRPWDWVQDFRRVPTPVEKEYTLSFLNAIPNTLRENGFCFTALGDSLYAVTLPNGRNSLYTNASTSPLGSIEH